MKRTKIVATLGPASMDSKTLEGMLHAGVNVFRVNFSHGSHEQHRNTIKNIREILDRTGIHAAILADLQGPKLRVGHVEEGAVVAPGDRVVFTNVKCEGTKERVYMTYSAFPLDVNPGETILLDDGKLMMRVISTNRKDEVVTEVVQGGPLKSKKGVNLPNTRVSLPCLTEKDLEDLQVAMDEAVDWIGLSFVRNAQDIKELRAILDKNKSNAGIIAKIEKPEAVSDIEGILDATDGVMVARGDLGVEVPMESVPLIQKMIVAKAMERAKPVIVATQMMESMIDSMTPSRAEVNDVANAVLDGADAVMLSGETSIGKYPIEVVAAMAKIVMAAENSPINQIKERRPKKEDRRFVNRAICYQAAKMANLVGARAICTLTFSGYSAQLLSSFRPKSDIYAFTSNRAILNKVSLYWGVCGYFYDGMESTDQTMVDITQTLKGVGLIEDGDHIIQLASMPILQKGTTNTMRIKRVGE
ncbi:MAG TPA: pyruvate kinase [Cryomorphaceae bacterium]|jgi:pyruvate kinase|nr:MAG: pyruvate kinase [Cryomorphaceae bacterium BACL7 MAG-120910-bin2]KRO68471.1 MAG: pyruvate kinase [Cryomorphaceae bacterium BACL7 MAG-120322-bin74]KRO83061.1 MAG: pyruvate kinase [Cryomorphaceae bacterium BACL7 MAG-121220-bin83]HAB31099.1 pyruvate kinase [Cryomorphaceae bacterium]HAG49249.1 pyruvate kinase [Cryomorphaceae bacterium]|tara:strand:+ start:2736 stop:4154 length:1419 start_codon:yes stop_codon:yes gene_type:complete